MSCRWGFPGQRALALAVLAGALALAGCAGEYPQSVFRPVTDFAVTLDNLFTHVFWWTIVILVVVEVILVFVILRYRQRPGQLQPKQIHGNALLEIVWTIIPALIVVFIAVPTIRTIFDTYEPAGEDALIVEAVAHQWWWQFHYPEYGITTANQLYLPVGRQVEIRLRSNDVLHNFWVPRLGGKRYNYPQRVRPGEEPRYNFLVFTIDEAGEYPGQCAEFCGVAHALMRMMVVAQPEPEFQAWVQQMRAPVEPAEGSLEAQGREIFLRSTCIACHTIEGTTARGVLGPNLTRFGTRWSIGAGAADNTLENIAQWIRDPQSIKPGALMPGTTQGAAGMPPTGLSDQEVAAVAAYLHSLR